MNPEDLHESEIPRLPPSSNLSPREQILKDAVMKLFMARHSSEPPSLKAQKIKLIEDNISSFFPALRTRPTHPPYATMVMEAIKEMNEEGGSNVDDISKYIEKNFQGLPFAHSHFLKHYLKKLVDSGEILYSYYTACYALPPHLYCKPSSEREKEHEQQHQQQQQKQKEKRSRGRLRRKYVAVEEGDGLVNSGDLGNLLKEVQTDSVQLWSNNNEDLMDLGREGEKHQRGDYSNTVFGLEANPLQHQPVHHQGALVDYANTVVGLEANTLLQQRLMDGGRSSRIHVNQRETVEQHHQSACAKPVQEKGKRKGRGRPRKILALQEIVKQQHLKEVVEEPLQHQQETVGELSQQRQSKGRGRPRKIHAHQQENVEQHHQNADSKPMVEIEPEFLQEPCLGRPLEMHVEQETEEQQNPTSDSYAVGENEEGSSQQQHSKRRGRGRPRKEPVIQETVKHHTPTVENNTVVGNEVGPLDQLSEPQGVPSKKCEAEQSEMSKSISISYDDEDVLVHAHQLEIVEQHYQNADSKPVVEIEPEFLQEPCRGRPLGILAEQETEEQRNHTSDSCTVVENDGGSPEQPQSKRRGRGRPRKEHIKHDEAVMHHTPIVENNTVVGIEVGPLHQSSEPQGVPSEKCEAELSEMSESLPIFYGDEDGLIVLGEGNTLTSVIDAPAMENQRPMMAVAKEADAAQTHQLPIIEQQHRNIDAILAVGAEVGYVQAEKSEKCETEHVEMIQTFYGEGSENEAPPMENQPPKMDVPKDDDNIDANLTEVAHMLGLKVLGNSPTSVIEVPPTEFQPPWMIISDTGNTEQIHQQGIIEQHHLNIDVNLAVGTEVADLQAEINEECQTKQAEMSESVQTFYGDEDGLIFVGDGNSFASVIEVVPLECQPPWMVLSEEGDTEQIHRHGMIEQQHRNTDVNLALGTEIEQMQAEVKDKCETEQAHTGESIQIFCGDEDGLIVMGNDNSSTSAIEAPQMENQPPLMAVTKECDSEQLHQQGILEQQHPNIDFNLDVVTEVGLVQKEQQLNHKGKTTGTHEQSKTELEEKSESIRQCADDSTEGGVAGEVFPDKRPKEVAFPDKRRKEVVTLLQQQSKRQLRPRPHEPYKGRLRRLKHTTYHV